MASRTITDMIIKKCVYCNKIFSLRNTKLNNKRVCCSKICSNVYNGKRNKNKIRTQQFKDSLSKKMMGKNNHFYNKKHSNDTKLIISTKNKINCENRVKRCNITDVEHEILDGIMLADGHLETSRISSRITYGSKFKQTLEDIQQSLSSLSFSNIWKSSITNCYHFKSLSYKDLKLEHDRWYINKIKIVPIDIRITPLSCYWWYIGDGYNEKYGLYLYTNAFLFEEVENLRQKLLYLGFQSTYIKSNNCIRIRSRSKKDFLDWIGQYGISQQYLYKWR